MKIILQTCMACAVLLGICLHTGCTSGSLQEKEDSSKSRNSSSVKPQERAGRELLKAFVEDDAQGFLKLLPEVVSTQFGVNGFKKTRASMVEQLGDPVAYAFVMNLEHPLFTVSIWRILFMRKSADGKKDIRQESLFRAVSGKVDGKKRLLSFNFF